MKAAAACGLVLAAIASLPADDASFPQWWSAYQATVRTGSPEALAKQAHFPLIWENGPIREIKTEADFIRNFAKYFTPEIRRAIQRVKPERNGYGTYMVTWKSRGNEYSLYFKPDGPRFILDGLSEGPP